MTRAAPRPATGGPFTAGLPGDAIEADGPRILQGGQAGFEQLHQLIETQRVGGRELLVVADASERVARLCGGPRVGGRAALRVRPAGPAGRLEALALRLLDLVVGSILLLLLSPVMLAIGLAVRISSPGPILHEALVVGHEGRRFRWRKFRTMRAGAGEQRHFEAARRFITGTDREFRAAGVFKLQRDDRITRPGAFLRRHSLDELPQLLDVLAGRMSLVGPRPCLPYEWELYAPYQRRRLDVLPGLTGLWQARGRSRVSFDEMVLMDRLWAWNRSVPLYLELLLRTARVVLRGEGGY